MADKTCPLRPMSRKNYLDETEVVGFCRCLASCAWAIQEDIAGETRIRCAIQVLATMERRGYGNR